MGRRRHHRRIDLRSAGLSRRATGRAELRFRINGSATFCAEAGQFDLLAVFGYLLELHKLYRKNAIIRLIFVHRL